MRTSALAPFFDSLDHVQVRLRVKDKQVNQLQQGLLEGRSQLRALILGKQLSNALSSDSVASSSSSATAATAMGIAAMKSCEQIAFNVGSAISTSRNAVDQVSDLSQEVGVLVDEHQNMMKRLLDQEK